jgi:hypothetical protein
MWQIFIENYAFNFLNIKYFLLLHDKFILLDSFRKYVNMTLYLNIQKLSVPLKS